MQEYLWRPLEVEGRMTVREDKIKRIALYEDSWLWVIYCYNWGIYRAEERLKFNVHHASFKKWRSLKSLNQRCFISDFGLRSEAIVVDDMIPFRGPRNVCGLRFLLGRLNWSLESNVSRSHLTPTRPMYLDFRITYLLASLGHGAWLPTWQMCKSRFKFAFAYAQKCSNRAYICRPIISLCKSC